MHDDPLRRNLTLHIAVDRSNVDKVLGEAPDFVTYVDGDGWRCWGEAPGTDINDEDTLHVQIVSESLTELTEILTYLDALGLVERDRDDSGSQGAAITSSAMWSARVMSGPQIRHFEYERND